MLVVIAEKEELKLVEELGYSGCPVLITGVGAINVIKALKDLPRTTDIINIGYCGSNCIDVGTQVTVTSVSTLHKVAEFDEEPMYCLVDYLKSKSPMVHCYTSTDFVTETNIEEPCVFDMELAYIRSMFDYVKSIKVVSDNLNKKEYENRLTEDKK